MKKIAFHPMLLERYKRIFGTEYESYVEYCSRPLPYVIRTNTLKISAKELQKKLIERDWNMIPVPFYPDAFTVATEETLGNTREHFLGQYYVQGAASMIPPLALDPKPGEMIMDLCASPGSKSTQIAQLLQNKGVLLANEQDQKRIFPLVFNLQRCGVINSIVTQHSGAFFKNQRILFDRILVDAPCSAEGTVRKDSRLPEYLNVNLFHRMSKLQKELVRAAIACLKPGGTLVYSTCTVAPEENEGVIQQMLHEYPDLKVETINIPGLKTRPGLTGWEGLGLTAVMKKTIRVYPQDNDTEGFFVAKLVKQ